MNEYESLLRACKLNKAGLARALGVSSSTVYHWDAEPPAYVLAFLRLYRDHHHPIIGASSTLAEHTRAIRDTLAAAGADINQQLQTIERMG